MDHSSLTGVVLVEGASDATALATLARRRDRDLAAEGVAIVATGGSKNIPAALARFGPHGRGVRVAGLYDVPERADVERGLARAGLGAQLDGHGIEAAGFYACVADLEDELIRALGVPRVEQIVEEQGELPAFRILQRQPAHRGRAVEAQLRRFLGTRSGRKLAYASLLVENLDLTRVPRPLDLVLAHV